jgi:hypothetical protein
VRAPDFSAFQPVTGARANAVFTSLLASCRMLEVEPWSYLLTAPRSTWVRASQARSSVQTRVRATAPENASALFATRVHSLTAIYIRRFLAAVSCTVSERRPLSRRESDQPSPRSLAMRTRRPRSHRAVERSVRGRSL